MQLSQLEIGQQRPSNVLRIDYIILLASAAGEKPRRKLMQLFHTLWGVWHGQIPQRCAILIQGNNGVTTRMRIKTKGDHLKLSPMQEASTGDARLKDNAKQHPGIRRPT